jgi:hypothetical protein
MLPPFTSALPSLPPLLQNPQLPASLPQNSSHSVTPCEKNSSETTVDDLTLSQSQAIVLSSPIKRKFEAGSSSLSQEKKRPKALKNNNDEIYDNESNNDVNKNEMDKNNDDNENDNNNNNGNASHNNAPHDN